MPEKDQNRPRTRSAAIVVGVALALLIPCLGLAACGSSSKSSTTTNASVATVPSSGSTGPGERPGTSTGPSGPTGPTGPRGAIAGRFKAIRECLQKNGIKLPKRNLGQHSPGGPGGLGGFQGGATGPQLPSGVTRAQYEAALKKCGGGAFPGRGRRFQSPAFKQALDKFASCMRENGVKVPEPNTSGNGPIFSTKGIDTTSRKFKTAEAKCSSDLRNSLRLHPGYAPGGPPSSGANAG
jgi:hypothetical protein